MTRSGLPLHEVELFEPIETQLSTNRSFIELQALRLWGANLGDLKAWRDGNLDQSLVDLAVYFYVGDTMYNNHRQDAVAIETHNRAEKAKAKRGKS